MILVTVGTNEAPFDRLLEVFDRPAAAELGEEIVVQHGSSSVRPAHATCVPFLPYDALVHEICRARVVVMHAGVGSVMTALGNGARPIVVPRLERYGEAVDDHQVALSRRLADEELVTLVESPDLLLDSLGSVDGASEIVLGPDPRLVRDLRSFIAESRRR